MTVSGVTAAITLKNLIDFGKWTVFLNILKFHKNYSRHITSTTTICSKHLTDIKTMQLCHYLQKLWGKFPKKSVSLKIYDHFTID